MNTSRRLPGGAPIWNEGKRPLMATPAVVAAAFLSKSLRFGMSSPSESCSLRRAAQEILGFIDASRALVFGDLRIRAQRARTIHLSAGAVRRDDLVRRHTVFNPLFERADLIEHVRTFAAAAMTHARFHKQPNILRGIVHAAQVRDDALVITRRVHGRDIGIAPALVKKKLAAVGEKWLHVWIRGIHDQVFRQIAAYDILIEIESLPVPFRIFEYDVAV